MRGLAKERRTPYLVALGSGGGAGAPQAQSDTGRSTVKGSGVKSDEFIREVDEELRRDRVASLWRRYGALILGVAVLIVAGTAAWVGWQHWAQQARAAEALRFRAAERALAANDTAAATAQFAALAAEGRTGFAELARLREAQMALDRKEPQAALDALDGLAGDGGGDPIMRDLAALLAIEQQLDGGDPATLEQQLAPLAAAGSTWRNQARELQALVAIRAGDLDRARSILGELSREVGVQPSQQQRAAELLQAIGGSAAQASS